MKTKYILLTLMILCNTISIFSQNKTYNVNIKNEIYYFGTGIGLSILGNILVNNTQNPTLIDLTTLDRLDVPGYDRGAISNYSSSAQTISDIILFTGSTLPFITYFSKNCRTEGASIGIMAVETFLITNGITNIAKGSIKRFRPFSYNPDVPLEVKLKRSARLSFFSGHASNTAAMSFFAARVITDLHPDMKNKFIVWTTSATIPAIIGYLRYKAGKHYPTDIISGYAVGALIGYFLPAAHLNKKLNIQFVNTNALTLRLKF